MGLNLKDDDSITDLAGNPLAGTDSDLGDFTGELYRTNLSPTVLSLSNQSLLENNDLSSLMGSFSTEDDDAGDTHTYTLVPGEGDDHNGLFFIAGADLRVATIFNFEAQNEYSIRVRSEDELGGAIEEVFNLTVVDVNEAPTSISIDNAQVEESDEANIFVGNLSTVDEDAEDDFTYQLINGEGDDNNLLFRVDGNELYITVPINFEVSTSLSLRLLATDAEGLSVEQPLEIRVFNVENEPLRDFRNRGPGSRIKNFFSPNGDGINDTWVIEDILDNPINQVAVYAQNGKLIFSQRNYNNDWDGSFKGKPLPSGTYFYEVNVYNGQSIIKGFLTIIR